MIGLGRGWWVGHQRTTMVESTDRRRDRAPKDGLALKNPTGHALGRWRVRMTLFIIVFLDFTP
jgi:hypothetical protein